MNTKVYKSCVVPQCANTSLKAPNKLFIYLPHDKKTRDKWLKLARRDPKSFNLKSSIYFCEDHFDLPNDMENFMKYHVMGYVSQIRMKPGCVPTKFKCQSDRKQQSSDIAEPQYILQRQILIEEAMKELEEKSKPKKPLELEETSSSVPVPEKPKPITATKFVQVCIKKERPKFRSKAVQVGTKLRRGSDSNEVFPSEECFKKQWITKLNRKNWTPTKYTRICSCHFNEKDFKVSKKGYKRIKEGTLPSLNLDISLKTELPESTGGNDISLPQTTIPQPPSDELDEMSREKLNIDIERLRRKSEKAYLKIRKLQMQVLRLKKKQGVVSTKTPVRRGERSSCPDNDELSDTDSACSSHECECCECGDDVEGFRYVCAQCPVSLCGACAARGAHPAHYVLRIPHRATQDQVDAVLSSLRAQLGDDSYREIEIKEEPLDPLDGTPGMASNEEDIRASLEIDIVKEELPLQEPMDETGELGTIAKINEDSCVETENLQMTNSLSVHTHVNKPNEPRQELTPQQLDPTPQQLILINPTPQELTLIEPTQKQITLIYPTQQLPVIAPKQLLTVDSKSSQCQISDSNQACGAAQNTTKLKATKRSLLISVPNLPTTKSIATKRSLLKSSATQD